MKNRLFADLSDNNPYFHAKDYKNAGHVIVAHKSTEGQTYKDPTHASRVNASHAVGLSVIHYHFARPDDGNTPTQEVDNYLNTIKGRIKKGDWTALDYERFTGRGSAADVTWINEFRQRVHDAIGYRTWLYASRSTLQDLIAVGSPRLSIKRFWDADWGSSPDLKTSRYWTIARQQSGDGIGPGPHSLQGVGQCDVDKLSLSLFLHMRRH